MTATLRMTLLALLCAVIALPAMAEDVVPAYEASLSMDVDPVKLPDVEKKSLKNGLDVYYIPDTELPAVSLRLMLPAGALFNPMDMPGLNNAMAAMLTKGTTTRTAQEISAAIDFVGGSLNSGAGNNTMYVTSRVLSRDLDLALELMADVVMNPTFPEEEIARERQQAISNLMSKVDQPSTIASDQWANWVYGDHPYSLPTEGTIASMQAITRDDLVAQHKKLIVPGHAVLILAGDIDPGKAHKRVKAQFGGWSGAEPPEAMVEAPKPLPGRQILLIDKPDAVQSEVRMGYLLAPYNMGDDKYPFEVMDYAYGGGGFSSRLMKRIRTELGITYGLYSGLSARVQTGAYTISGATGNETTGQFIGETLRLMEEAIENGFTEDELRDAKSYKLGSYPRQFETPTQVASKFQEALIFGYGDPEEHIAEYRKKVAKVDLDAMNDAADRFLDPSKVRIVVVGKAEDVLPQIEEFGEVTVKTVDELKSEM